MVSACHKPSRLVRPGSRPLRPGCRVGPGLGPRPGLDLGPCLDPGLDLGPCLSPGLDPGPDPALRSQRSVDQTDP